MTQYNRFDLSSNLSVNFVQSLPVKVNFFIKNEIKIYVNVKFLSELKQYYKNNKVSGLDCLILRHALKNTNQDIAWVSHIRPIGTWNITGSAEMASCTHGE